MAAAAVHRGATERPDPSRESSCGRTAEAVPPLGDAPSGMIAAPSAGVSARFNGGGAPGTGLPGAG
ncbi:hypothetical protein [Mycolicibacterium baixiangningiae]|uniref:hypothetical protein n=1 Tax=Mycolicibacterium baixiangningiae TaxID=2761578 RepID=UPI001867602B|nr:hypothetical protein [Mycolicibacterium baixiangningiae]